MREEELDEIERTLKTSKPYCELGTYNYFNCESIEKLLKENQQLKEQVQELKHIMYVIRDDNGLNHLWCKDMILDWLGSEE